MNHLQDFRIFKNRYIGMRHGSSQAEAHDLILSNADHCVGEYGLTEDGKEEVRRSVRSAVASGLLTRDTIIVTCDFLRCIETTEILTGEIVHACLLPTTGHLTDRLRDRDYGERDRGPISYRRTVWELDAMKPPLPLDDTESVDSVVSRTTRIAMELETSYTGKTIILVSHDETLRILQCAFQQRDPFEHMHLAPYATAEIREITSA